MISQSHTKLLVNLLESLLTNYTQVKVWEQPVGSGWLWDVGLQDMSIRFLLPPPLLSMSFNSADTSMAPEDSMDLCQCHSCCGYHPAEVSDFSDYVVSRFCISTGVDCRYCECLVCHCGFAFRVKINYQPIKHYMGCKCRECDKGFAWGLYCKVMEYLMKRDSKENIKRSLKWDLYVM